MAAISPLLIKALPRYKSHRGKQEIGSTEDADADKLIFTHLENSHWCTLPAPGGFWRTGILGALLNEGGSTALVSRLFHGRRHWGRYGVGFSESPPTLRCLIPTKSRCHHVYDVRVTVCIGVMDGQICYIHFTALLWHSIQRMSLQLLLATVSLLERLHVYRDVFSHHWWMLQLPTLIVPPSLHTTIGFFWTC